jgi:hypothetical protein
MKPKAKSGPVRSARPPLPPPTNFEGLHSIIDPMFKQVETLLAQRSTETAESVREKHQAIDPKDSTTSAIEAKLVLLRDSLGKVIEHIGPDLSAEVERLKA